MSVSIALMSGKGGSGKTSLALTMASLLSECKIKTLMIDCDMATNGATYFFESMLNDGNGELDSVDSILQECILPTGTKGINSLRVKEYFSFFPSIRNVKESHINYAALTEEQTGIFWNVMGKIQEKYDVLIYDFQAGYSELMNLLLPMIDVVLFVIEPDAVSASSLRSLYLKIGVVLESKKTYQVFNKASEEEYKIYSKLYSGTLFTTIDTIRFDWEIRKAFSLAEIPTIENCSYQYLKQVIELSARLITDTDLRKALSKYRDMIEINRIDKRNQEIRRTIKNISRERDREARDRGTSFKKGIIRALSSVTDLPFFFIFAVITVVIGIAVPSDSFPDTVPIKQLVISISALAVVTVIIMIITRRVLDSDTQEFKEKVYLEGLAEELRSLEVEKQNLLNKHKIRLEKTDEERRVK